MRVSSIVHTTSCFVDRDMLDKHRIFEAPIRLSDGDREYVDDGPVQVDEAFHDVQTALAEGRLQGSPPPSDTYRELLETALSESDAVYGFLPGEAFMGSTLARVGQQLAGDEGRIRFWYHDTMPPAASLLAVQTTQLAREAETIEKLETSIDALVNRTVGVLVVPRFNDIVGAFTRIEHYRDRPFEVYPVVTGGEDGAIVPVTAVCTLEQAYEVIIDCIKRVSPSDDDIENAPPVPKTFAIMDILAEPAAEGLRQRLQEAFPDAEEIEPLKGGIAAATIIGRGAFGVAFTPKRGDNVANIIDR